MGDIYNAFQEEQAAAQRITPVPKPPVPTPRSDLEMRRQCSVDFTGAPSEEAPPMPGAPPGHNPGKKISPSKYWAIKMSFLLLSVIQC